ncbi:MAG: hypothetical protein LUD16_07045 [Lachnospiraceae bacterium]|nr:hypothetical protein [Lachnospiraceae bacterium]
MRKKICRNLCVVCLAAGVAIGLCQQGWNVRAVENGLEQADESEKVEEITMTEEQKELLKKISADDERVESGNLFDWQIEVLRQYEYAMEYLRGKYPSHTFEIYDCTQKSKLNSYTTFWFNADGEEESYELYLWTEGEDAEEETEKETETVVYLSGQEDNFDYLCKDNFYCSLICDSYAGALLELVREEVPECVGVLTVMTSVNGEDCDESLDISDILAGKYEITNSTRIFLDGSNSADASELFEQVKSLIGEKRIYGSYLVVVLTEVPESCATGEQMWDYVKENGSSSYLLRQSFQQFNS